MDKLTPTQVWSLPDFTIQQYVTSKYYQPENYVIDRLLITQILSQDDFLDSDLDILDDEDAIDKYQLDDKDVVNGKSIDLMKNRFDLIVLSLGDSGKLYTFGSNDKGQLGLGSYTGPGDFRTEPNLVEYFADRKVKSVSCGISHTAVITEDGELYTFGSNYWGQLGLGTSGPDNRRSEPTLVEYFQGMQVKSVSCEGWYTAVITEDGQLYTFGINSRGQLGLGTSGENDKRTEPALVEYFADRKVKSVSCGGWYTAVITEDGQLYTFGINSRGQLGLGTSGENERNEPTLVSYFEGMEVKSVSCGQNHTAAITEDGQLYTFGNNDDGQLGLGTSGENDKRTEPTLVEFFQGMEVKSVSCGGDYTAVVAED